MDLNTHCYSAINRWFIFLQILHANFFLSVNVYIAQNIVCVKNPFNVFVCYG